MRSILVDLFHPRREVPLPIRPILCGGRSGSRDRRRGCLPVRYSSGGALAIGVLFATFRLLLLLLLMRDDLLA